MRRVKAIVKKFDALRFAVVGVMNTLLDFTILNILLSLGNISLIVANIMSTTVVMIFSFKANSILVFKGGDKHKKHKQAVLFIAGTLFGLYIIQIVIIATLTHWWTGPVNTISEFITNNPNDERLIANIAKLVATSASMVWNYLFYKYIVFKKNES